MGIKQSGNRSEQELKKTLKQLLDDNRLSMHRQFVKRLAQDLQVSMLDCAAVLSLLNQPDLLTNQLRQENIGSERKSQKAFVAAQSKQKQVRYRLDIGTKHGVTTEQIKDILIEVSGVEKQRIGRLDIRNQYTLVDLPDGMPADIFHLLSEAEINQRKLNLKRLKFYPRYGRRNNARMQRNQNKVDNTN